MAGPADAGLCLLAEGIAAHFTASGRRLVTAESCTGGWVAKACTDLPGSSRWFAGGIVAYANDAKQRLLGVPAATLDRHGAVSAEVVRAMAVGALERLGGDVAVAVSGVAGPGGGTAEKPVGTVWFAWARRSAAGDVRVVAACERFGGDRDEVRRRAVACALAGVLELPQGAASTDGESRAFVAREP